MPSILCTCGTKISYSEIPCPSEWSLVSAKDIDGFADSVSVDELYLKSIIVLKCASCGRLWVYWNGFSAIPTEYVPVRERPDPSDG
ncbi:MAG: hypothetical protein U0230_27540 [Polyangiales bacterium]